MGDATAPLLVGAITSFALVAAFVAASWLAGWYEERARRALAAVRHGVALRPGFGAVHGTARPLGERSGGLLLATTVTQVRFGGGAWRESERVTTGVPFVLVLDGGEEIEVDPGAEVADVGVARPSYVAAFARDLVGRVSTGDEVWATGVVSRLDRHAAGAYRSSPARRRLTAPRRGRVELSAESPIVRWTALAGAHKRGAYWAAGTLVLAHALVYRNLDLAFALRRELDCTSILRDPRAIAPLLAGGVIAFLVAVVAWANAVDKAKRSSLL